MSLRAILSGAVGKAAELRTSKNGNSFATLSIRENHNGATRWWQAIAFNEVSIETLKEMAAGEPVAVCGEITAEIYAPAGSGSRINWRVTIDAVLTAHKPPKVKSQKTARASAPEPRPGRAISSKSWASQEPIAVGGVPLNDTIPFSPEWR